MNPSAESRDAYLKYRMVSKRITNVTLRGIGAVKRKKSRMAERKEPTVSGSEHDGNTVATIFYRNGTELTGKAVTLQDGTVGVRIPGEFFKTALLSDGSMPDGVISVDIGPKHVEGGLPLTDDMVYKAVTAMLRDAVGLPLNEASDAYEAWLNRVRRDAIEHWGDSLPERESTRLHRRYLDRDGAGHPKEEGAHDADRA